MPRKTRTSSSRSSPQLLLGAHMSIAGGVDKAYERAASIGCTAMQIFVKNNMQWFAKPLEKAEVAAFLNHPMREKVPAVFGHSGYLINLAATNPEFLQRSRLAMAAELERADQLGLPFLVLHPGAHMGAGEEAGLARIVESLDEILGSLPRVKTRIALETTAGQGSSLGCRFEHLAHLLSHVRQPQRLCVCLDTAHVFAAGYDLSTEKGTRETFKEFDRVIGRTHLAALHLNDSKAALGSRVDRHEAIGAGKIGLAAFRHLMNEREFSAVPKVLETPKGKELREDVENMRILRELVAG